MGLSDLFSKDGRESIRSKAEYEECYKARQNRLHSYRKNAVQDMLLKYPDARLLLNRLDRRFMAVVASEGSLLVGKFADDYYPRLDYLGDSASSAEKRTAVSQFRNQASRCVGNISEASMPRFDNFRRWLSEDVINSFQTRGYAITGGAELKYLIGGALFLNQRCIAKASIWDTKPKGYFNTKLWEEIVQHTDRRPGTQVLTFVTGDCTPCEVGQKMSCEIIFDRSIHCFDKDNRNEFTDSILNLGDFLNVLEDYFRTDCPGGDDDRAEYTHPDSARLLESADRDHDQSIESRYLL